MYVCMYVLTYLSLLNKKRLCGIAFDYDLCYVGVEHLMIDILNTMSSFSIV